MQPAPRVWAMDSRRALAACAFASIALHQRLSLEQIAEGVARRDLPAREMQTPGWFAAAAGEGARLADVAPELHDPDPDAEPKDALDLIRMYAPELQGDPLPALAPTASPSPTRGVRLDLLAELRDIDT